MATDCTSTRDIIVRTSSLAIAQQFYGEVMGFNASYESAELLGFDTGAFTLYVEPGEPHGPVFEYLVTDVAATKQRLLKAGCALVEEDPGVPRVYLRDPFGVIFNVGKVID